MAAHRCSLCGALATTTRVLEITGTDTADRFAIQRCDECGVLQTTPVPDDLGPYYTTDLAATMTHRGNSLFAALKARQLAFEARRLAHHAGQSRLLDVGCGTGDFSVAARQQGREVIAADRTTAPPPAIAAASGIGYVRFDFDACTIQGAHPGGPYTVVLRHVLEHARDPLFLLERLREQGGERFYIVVPNAASLERRMLGRHWYSWDPPRHLWHFDDTTLDLVCQRARIAILARGRGTAPTLLPSLYRSMRVAGWPAQIYRPFGPDTGLTAILSPLNLLLPGNVSWRIGRAAG